MTEQGDRALLDDPVAQELLSSRQPARLAYTWTDGTPRVVPLWFHWTGEEVVFGTPVNAPKVKVLQERPSVAVTIDDASAWPYRALMLRGNAEVEIRDSVLEEYVAASHRYFGQEQGDAWCATLRGVPMARVSVRPDWVGVLDFETRLPSALTA
jgi:nitroimidazol reductase NimA-like FMN-containing flavoprotein (pyridoxamine 5'-phosphate oxidase superfamily)